MCVSIISARQRHRPTTASDEPIGRLNDSRTKPVHDNSKATLKRKNGVERLGLPKYSCKDTVYHVVQKAIPHARIHLMRGLREKNSQDEQYPAADDRQRKSQSYSRNEK